MEAIPAARKSYGNEADIFLADIYRSFDADTTPKKIELLESKFLGGGSNFYAFGGDLTEDMKLGCLEYEFLEQMGKITLVLA
jgi:hypothetical protein